VARDGVVRHLERYAAENELAIRTGRPVTRTRSNREGGWRIATSAGEIDAAVAVVGDRSQQRAVLPDWPGRSSRGELVHSADFRNAEPYRGRDVLVVGSGTRAPRSRQPREGGAARVAPVGADASTDRAARPLGIPAQVLGLALGKLPSGRRQHGPQRCGRSRFRI
jgi:putative flavoprotein involved in K+ transport